MGFMPVAPRAQEAVPLSLAPELFTSTFPYPGVGKFMRLASRHKLYSSLFVTTYCPKVISPEIQS